MTFKSTREIATAQLPPILALNAAAFSEESLKFWKDTGYELTGCLPMGRKLSFGAKKEIWMFRGSVPRTTSIRSRRSVNEQRERERERCFGFNTALLLKFSRGLYS